MLAPKAESKKQRVVQSEEYKASIQLADCLARPATFGGAFVCGQIINEPKELSAKRAETRAHGALKQQK